MFNVRGKLILIPSHYHQYFEILSSFKSIFTYICAHKIFWYPLQINTLEPGKDATAVRSAEHEHLLRTHWSAESLKKFYQLCRNIFEQNSNFSFFNFVHPEITFICVSTTSKQCIITSSSRWKLKETKVEIKVGFSAKFKYVLGLAFSY